MLRYYQVPCSALKIKRFNGHEPDIVEFGYCNQFAPRTSHFPMPDFMKYFKTHVSTTHPTGSTRLNLARPSVLHTFPIIIALSQLTRLDHTRRKHLEEHLLLIDVLFNSGKFLFWHTCSR